ncbi:MAG: cation:proton antiporter [Candidatus Omnitrophica bacterium]|jgi:Kef-type K+ transport system membrane component KefB/mannitol/fructose-specific phosphotransferase system IIA component|nr:cation:proton antiporter [Candidatus Omnitrophota bacterium]MDD5077606.1 cation:proton antiporter [Candidatus Omnitrophota bacterium]
MHYLNENNIFIFLVQLALLLGLARGVGEIFRRWRQPPLTAELLVGIFMGPTILGRFLPAWHQAIFPGNAVQQNMFETAAWIGVLFLLLESGLEIDFASAWRQRGDALKIALADIVVPMGIAFIPCFLLPDSYLVNPQQRFIFAVFMATVMTISALPIAARALHDLKIFKTDLGFLIMSALSVNDILGWLIFTLVLGFFIRAGLNIWNVISVAALTIVFTAFCLTAGRKIVDKVITGIKNKKMPQPGISLTFICVLGALCGAATQKIGIHALFGFFIAGIMAGGSRALSENVRQVISQMVYAIFVPLFFVNIGLKVDFLGNFDIFLILLVSGIGIAGRFAGAWLGVNLTRLPKTNRLSIAVAHIPGGAMEIVVGSLALEYNLITEPVFVAIVFGAVISSVILGPWLSYSIRKRKEISILEYFSARGIVSSLRHNERDKVIEELCELAAGQLEAPDAEDIYKAVIARENEMGTAIEEGIAVPHARLPEIKTPLVIFGRSVDGAEWNSPDDKPVHFVFLILTPGDGYDTQVQVLSFIAKAMSDAETRGLIAEAGEAHEIWEILQRAFAGKHVVKNKKKT